MADTPNRPTFQAQNPAISGCNLGWLSCTCFACAMALDVVFFGRKKPTGCQIRSATGDTSGGTTLPQVASVAHDRFGVTLELHVGANVCRPTYAAKQARLGRGFLLQGGTHPLLSTPHRSTAGNVNHCVWVNEVRGGTDEVPAEALVYDPAADAHLSYVDQAPSWWPWSLVCQFAAALQPWGQDDPRTIGGGKFYAAFVPPPRIKWSFGAATTTPFPDQMATKSPIAGRRVNVRSRPDRLVATDVIDHLPDGVTFTAYQKAQGAKPLGSTSRTWFGDWTGTRWVHASNLVGQGGVS